MKPRAFLFDGDPVIQALFEHHLENRGYETITFRGPGVCPTFTPLTCQCPPGQVCADVSISSLLMPTGRSLYFVERQLKKGCRIRHVALVADEWSEADRVRAQELGCQLFSRPVDGGQFYRWLDEVEETIDPERKLFNQDPK